ncbi:hypothetical protein M413DRAFT_66307 [Hebeloma cylindrosporum]|uniref:PWWP domain-containing protein n=1 Tax=Hebeloma cylindrosporum TaxID=76867 RepID=A0A0C3CPI8_HEBCY|nr:hypothetical protein M413DRAFT_66307 [Hebeloma cylindrosporum h7]
MSKKSTKNAKESRAYDVGEAVLGKIRGYPPWPGIIIDAGDAPPAVLNDQPPNKKANFHCVMFFPAGEYAWLHPKDMSALLPHEIEAFLADDNKKRNGELHKGYQIALDSAEFVREQRNNVRALKESMDNAQVDQLESENEEGGSTSKKRKRDSDAEPAAKAKRAPKAPTKKKDSAEPPKKKSAKGGKKNGAKSKALIESEDEGDGAEGEDDDEDAGPSKKTSPPPAKKAKRDKDDGSDYAKGGSDPQSLKVRDWRHKLQKTFLSNKTMPKAENVPEIDNLFTLVENYDEMTIEQLQFSKIGKVMRHIASLTPEKAPPRENEFNFRKRAKALVDKWHQILNANKPANGSPVSAAGGQRNGNAEGDKEKTEDEVTSATKNLDLNWKGLCLFLFLEHGRFDNSIPFLAEPNGDTTVDEATGAEGDGDLDAPAEADSSILPDVTMSEA